LQIADCRLEDILKMNQEKTYFDEIFEISSTLPNQNEISSKFELGLELSF